MGTTCQTVYDAFKAKILDDEWDGWDISLENEDMLALLNGALPYFKFPRIDLTNDGTTFEQTLGSQEIQILSSYMKIEWLSRTILTWRNLKSLYSEKDFSQANFIDKLVKLQEKEEGRARLLESNYYRSIKGQPYSYRNWSGNG